MKYLDVTLPNPHENLALEDALLEEAESLEGSQDEVLRLWEMPTYCVVMGRSSKAIQELQLHEIENDRIPVLRRSSGGATVMVGPGCLHYSVLLSYEKRPELRGLDQAHAFVMGTLRDALLPLDARIGLRGTCDLTWMDRKVSGNALRCKRRFFLYHGTLLYNFPLHFISKYLLEPPRQPDYRQKRRHEDFVANLPMDVGSLRTRIREAWNAQSDASMPSDSLLQQILLERYLNPSRNQGLTQK